MENMNLSNKENIKNHQNTVNNIFKNTFISHKISPSLQSEDSTDSIKERTCPSHLKPFGNLFCVQCLSYKVCSGCISELHAEHEILHFPSQEDLLSGTKETILENLEETLKQLKSRENEVKNRAYEIDLVRTSLKNMEEQIVQIISGIFKQIQGRLTTSLSKNNTSYEDSINNFFDSFNRVNDDLRENLMQIIDGEIDVNTFTKDMVIKAAPSLPDFQKHRNNLEKFKRVFRQVKNELTNVKKVLEAGCDCIDSNFHMGQQSALTKFDKYIESRQIKAQKVNESFMKTLNLIGGDKKDLAMFRSKMGGMDVGKKVL